MNPSTEDIVKAIEEANAEKSLFYRITEIL